MPEKKKSFKQALKRTRIGLRHEIETMNNEFYFHPVKYSVEGSDALNAVMLKNKDVLSGDALKKLKTIIKDKDLKSLSQEELVKNLSDDEFEEIFRNIKTDTIGALDLNRVRLKYGIGSNNFGDGVSPEGALVRGGVPDDFVDEILMNSEITNEMVGVINIWNSPLVRKQQ